MIRKIKNKINKKFKDQDFSEIFKKSASGFFISILGRNFGFLQQLVITNYYGAAAFGVFRVCFSILSLVGIFGRFGVDMAISRFVAQYRKQDKMDLVNEIFQIGLKLVFPIGIALTIGVYFLAPWISDRFYSDANGEVSDFTPYIRIFSVGIIFFVLSGVIEEGIRGLKKIKEYTWINNVSTQAFSIVVLLVALLFTTNIYVVNISYVLGLLFTFILGVYYWLKFVPYKKVEKRQLSTRELLNVSLPMLSAKYLTTLYTWLGTLILAAYVAPDEVGVFNAAARMSAFATMPLIAVNNISGPRFAEAFGENNEKSMRKTVRLATRLIFWTALPIMLLFYISPNFIMGLYGKEFGTEEAILTFAVINAGQVVNLLTGPVTQLLNMTGRQLVTQRYAILTTFTSIGLSLLLIPSMGMLGAALATAIARTVLNLGCALHIYFTMKIVTIYNPFADIYGLIKRYNKKNS